jgi:uncharacterized protein YajQ (UPF0234 family)
MLGIMPSFDIVSKVAWHEVDNAVNQAQKELSQRFDFKDTETEVVRGDNGITLQSSSEDRVKAAWTVLQEKLIKRKVSLKGIEVGDPQSNGKRTKLTVTIKEGIEAEPAKEIVRRIKDAKLKVQASIQDQQVRVSGKNKDDLQQAMALVRGAGMSIELQFINFRD